jgi:hypothetical protein
MVWNDWIMPMFGRQMTDRHRVYFFFINTQVVVTDHLTPELWYERLNKMLMFKRVKCWIDYILFDVPLKNISLIWRRHHSRWRATKFRLMLGAQGLWAGRDLHRATPAMTRGLGFSGLIRRTAPFSRLLRHRRGCGGSILTRIHTGQTVKTWIGPMFGR